MRTGKKFFLAIRTRRKGGDIQIQSSMSYSETKKDYTSSRLVLLLEDDQGR